MSRLLLPASVQILQSISMLLEDSESLLSPKHSDFNTLQTIIASSTYFEDSDFFMHSPTHVRYLQALMLSGLSMYGGMLIPCLKQFIFKKNQVRLSWDTGISDHFEVGVWNQNFLTFSEGYLRRLQLSETTESTPPITLIHGIQRLIMAYNIIIESVDFRIQELFKGKSHFLQLLKQPLHHDLLFILVSSLPSEHMNQLFLFLQQYLPKDLHTQTSSGHRVNICALFQQSSMDISFLVEKSKLFLELYHTTDKPIIREITQHKTSLFLTKLLQNTKAYQDTLSVLHQMKTSQIDLRLSLYSLLLTHFDVLLI